MNWEIDWDHPESTGTMVMCRNPDSPRKDSRMWRLRMTGYLRKMGVNTPAYRKDSWEVDWGKRKGKQVWARNPASKRPCAREWHWVSMATFSKTGIKWRRAKPLMGRRIDSRGYAILAMCGMTEDEILLCDKHGLWRGKRMNFAREHHLVAVQKYGSLPKAFVVRHLNGIKDDNRPENLILGTIAENNMDHNTARLQAMLWRERFEKLASMFTPDQIKDGSAMAFIKKVVDGGPEVQP